MNYLSKVKVILNHDSFLYKILNMEINNNWIFVYIEMEIYRISDIFLYNVRKSYEMKMRYSEYV